MEEMIGKNVSEQIKNKVQTVLESSKKIPNLLIIRVGEEEDQISYEKNAMKKMHDFGINVDNVVFPIDVDKNEFEEEFKIFNESEDIDGILLLRPIPKHLSIENIAKIIDPKKDLDGMSPFNIEKIMLEDEDAFATCTAQAVIDLLKFYNVELDGARACVVNNSLVVGKSLSMLLLKEDATVTICHSHTKNLKEVTKEADIVIFGTGKAKFFDESYIKEGAVVVDVGINFDENGKLCGDCNFDSMSLKAKKITPVPGGVGAVTTAVLAEHIIKYI